MSEDLLDRLFVQAREVVLGEREHVEVGFAELVRLVSDEVLQARFRSRFRLEAQSPETRELLIVLLHGAANDALELAEQVRTDADGIDHYVGRPGLGMVAAAVAMLFGSSMIGGVVLLTVGALGVSIGGFGSVVLRKRANRLRAFGERLRALVGDLKSA